MRALEIDDILMPGAVHAGVVTQPPALALAERDHRSGKELMLAVAAGYEAIGKFGSGVSGWSAPMPRRDSILLGPFGGAVACAKLLRLDEARIANAIGYAAHSAMGVSEGSDWTHYYGLVARNGMLAALVAQAGGRVSPTVLEGRYGFYESFLGALPANLGAWTETNSEGAEILNVATKRYPGTGWNIVPIELLRAAIRAGDLEPRAVERLRIVLPAVRERFPTGHWAGPFERRRAASSLLFQLAMLLLDGGETRFERYEQPDHPDILALVSKMEVIFGPGDVDEYYVRLEIATTDGRRIVREGQRYTFPDPDPRAELLAAGEGVLPEERLHRAADLIEALPEVGDVAELLACLTPRR